MNDLALAVLYGEATRIEEEAALLPEGAAKESLKRQAKDIKRVAYVNDMARLPRRPRR